MPRSSVKKSAAPSAALVRSSAQQAENFRRSRRDRSLETAQDYVEAIADLTAARGEARVVDLARQLGVTHVTVNRTLARLQKGGFVKTEPYRAIFLTSTGDKLAAECKRRHETVVSFLRSLGISERVAELDAEGIEHHVSPETLAAFERRLKKILMRPLDLQRIGNEIAIKWDDGSEQFLSLEQLRRACPCAGCKGETDIMGNLYKNPEQPLTAKAFELVKIHTVGGYALQPVWADGHATGLFSFEYLKRV